MVLMEERNRTGEGGRQGRRREEESLGTRRSKEVEDLRVLQRWSCGGSGIHRGTFGSISVKLSDGSVSDRAGAGAEWVGGGVVGGENECVGGSGLTGSDY